MFLERFEQFSLSSHSSSSCKNRNCNFHTLLYDGLNSILSSEKFDLVEFRYQTVDCLFTVYHYYFRNVLKLFQKLTEASEFHRSLPVIALKRPSVAKKRLLVNVFNFTRSKADIYHPRTHAIILLVQLKLFLSPFVTCQKFYNQNLEVSFCNYFGLLPKVRERLRLTIFL